MKTALKGEYVMCRTAAYPGFTYGNIYKVHGVTNSEYQLFDDENKPATGHFYAFGAIAKILMYFDPKCEVVFFPFFRGDAKYYTLHLKREDAVKLITTEKVQFEITIINDLPPEGMLTFVPLPAEIYFFNTTFKTSTTRLTQETFLAAIS